MLMIMDYPVLCFFVGHGGVIALRESQRLAAELLGNACVGNMHCQEEAGICGAPRALVKMIRKARLKQKLTVNAIWHF
jgi:hypothetical protein